MAEWSTFFGAACVILVLLLVLARASASTLNDPVRVPAESLESTESTNSVGDFPVDTEPLDDASSHEPDRIDSEPAINPPYEQISDRQPSLSTPALLTNVALSQGLFASLLILLAWYTEIPLWAFGLPTERLTLAAVGIGIAVGAVLYLLTEAATAVGRRRGIDVPTTLREALTPESTVGWAVLLGIVLPIIAGFEELLFRGVLIGVAHAGFGVPQWLLAVGSSVAFGLGHNAQGRLGVVITGLLGLGLAAVFILTESLVVVIVAHYVINAAEFVVHET